MKQKIVGVYNIGSEDVELVLRDGTGGEFYATPEDGHIARIKVGADYKEWHSVVETLLHEAMECAACRMKCRFVQLDKWSEDLSGVTIIMSHSDFSDACARVGLFVSEALPDLARAWKAWGRGGCK